MEREERERRKKNIVFKGVKEEKGDGIMRGGKKELCEGKKEKKRER